MNIITKSDIKKHLLLLKAGIKSGTRKELSTYTSASKYGGIDVVKEYYVSLEFRFSINPDEIDSVINSDYMDNEIQDLLNEL